MGRGGRRQTFLSRVASERGGGGSGAAAAAPAAAPRKTAAAVFVGGRKVAVLGSRPAPAPAPPAPEPPPKRQRLDHHRHGAAGSVLFDPSSFRHWRSAELGEIDGELRRAQRDLQWQRGAARRRLEQAARDAERRGDVAPLNKAIADFGSEKQLGLARRALKRLLCSGLQPTEYTVASAVNSAVRCGETREAESYLRRGEAEWGVAPNEVIYTTLMKGLCSDGAQQRALGLLQEMSARGVQPNPRTCATLCRGAMRNADASGALQLVAKLRQMGIDVTRSPVCCEYLTRALVYGGRLEAAAGFIADGVAGESACACAAAAAALCGRDDLARAACAAARDPLRRTQGEGRGGGRGERSSAVLFNRLRDEETLRELDRVEDLLEARAAKGAGQQGAADPAAGGPPAERDWRADPHVRVLAPQGDHSKLELGSSCFPNPALPLRVEVCMGNGEWVVERARQERGEANWIGVEIRPDRVYQAWVRREMAAAAERDSAPANLLLVAGDARAVVAALRRATEGGAPGVDDLFVNFPEPPGWAGGTDLLDSCFWRDVHGALAVGGAATLVSDDAPYAARVAMTLARLGREGLYFPAVHPDGRPLSTRLPEGYGSSYFDRLWKSGKRKKRFCVHCVKPTPHVQGQPPPTPDTARRRVRRRRVVLVDG
eukprot:TRINITY_DN23807_c0_g1_i2.p1 TRINITY_DN23807_c0_g1~~TRINITY_DN23807_c0_g1_i2.p1  ORF type:complete len:682 (+),score=192.06 TRINITY_DN23807_c0_g1_i2:72-2048(+)